VPWEIGLPASNTGTVDGPSPGFNVIGHVSSNLGLGVTARCVVRLLRSRGHPVAIWDVDPGLSRRGDDRTFVSETLSSGARLPYRVNLFVLHPPSLIDLLGKNPWLLMQSDCFNVGFCPWELPVLPSAWSDWLESMDVLVAESSFIRSAFENHLSDVVVVSARHPLYLPTEIRPDRGRFGLPEDRVLFVTGFEPHSDPQRKNPFAAIDAFQNAFEGDDRAHLVVRVNNARVDGRPHPVLQTLHERAGHDQRIHWLEEAFTYSEVLSLYASCDAFVSLHRAEGLGLGPMEAMTLGKPVIATSWSGNMTYMNHVNSCLVRHRLIPVESEHRDYQRETVGDGAVWADPYVDDAAAWMRRLADDPELRSTIGSRAAADMEAFLEDAERGSFVDEVLAVFHHRSVLGRRPHVEAKKAELFKWGLRVADGNAASVLRLDHPDDAVTVAIHANETGKPFDIQLNRSRIEVCAGVAYSLSFLARADAERTIFAALSKANAPWTGLGLYREVRVSTEWRRYEEEFVVSEDESDARIHFDIGQGNDSVSFAQVTLRDLSTGREIHPNLTTPGVIPPAPPLP
jgi:glycosyltransferase involved in cell wall biosynthesis